MSYTGATGDGWNSITTSRAAFLGPSIAPFDSDRITFGSNAGGHVFHASSFRRMAIQLLAVEGKRLEWPGSGDFSDWLLTGPGRKFSNLNNLDNL